MFPHWGGRHVDQRDATGEVSAHLGTLVYRFDGNTRRRTIDGDDEPPPRCATAT